jgi:hypothetical protein
VFELLKDSKGGDPLSQCFYSFAWCLEDGTVKARLLLLTAIDRRSGAHQILVRRVFDRQKMPQLRPFSRKVAPTCCFH